MFMAEGKVCGKALWKERTQGRPVWLEHGEGEHGPSVAEEVGSTPEHQGWQQRKEMC